MNFTKTVFLPLLRHVSTALQSGKVACSHSMEYGRTVMPNWLGGSTGAQAFRPEVRGVFANSSEIATSPLCSPLRAELFSAAQMEQYGKWLASNHAISTAWRQDYLLPRLAQNEASIINACASLVAANQLGRQITPAAEWLLDNFYVIEEQIRTAKRHLPKNYSKQLPRLGNGNSQGLPRVYDIAQETVAHGDGRIDLETLTSFVAAYQQVVSLNLGELWAIPIMLRLALIENLARIASNLAATRLQRDLACVWSDRLAQSMEQDPNSLILVVADMARANPPLESAFVAEFVRRMQAHNPALLLPLTWLSQKLAESNLKIDTLVQIEAQRQAADQVSISNSIGSLRILTGVDWRIFVENLSAVEQCLRRDPLQMYSKMDFGTRDHYRHVVEKVARFGRLDELAVAQNALYLAENAQRENLTLPEHERLEDQRQQHVGYYLIGNGRNKLEHVASFSLPLWESLKRAASLAPLAWYLASIVVLSLFFTAAIMWVLIELREPTWVDLPASLLALLTSSQLAISLVNWVTTLMTVPKPLARLDYSHGIAPESATLVVVPSMLISEDNINQLVDGLELRFLANRDPHIQFGLLTDYCDASNEVMPNDAGLLLFAEKSIELLNQRYASEKADIVGARKPLEKRAQFLLFHRPRRWNPQENCWMGFERKRGKLAALNAYLRGQGMGDFELIVGASASLQNLRYIITLDTDTELPRDAARKFIATMAHPLNRAVFDARSLRVVEGYGILQPRVSVSLPGESASPYELLCAGELGLDPYTRSVSDVYQDVFGEGSFIGKGIYEIDTFELALKDRLPLNRILSHDLLEGCYARAGLISDVQLHERQPSSYLADATRRSRWIRGDWQIASWLLHQVPTTGREQADQNRARRNPLSTLSRWKLFDNLRRSLVPIAMMLLLGLCWTVLAAPRLGLAIVLAVFVVPSSFNFLFGLLQYEKETHWHQKWSVLVWPYKQQLMQAFLAISFLPFEAKNHFDAIARTQWRIMVSRKRLLQWKTSSEANAQAGDQWRFTLPVMWIAPVSAIAVSALLLRTYPHAFAGAVPILICWLFAPWTAAWFSRAAIPAHLEIAIEQRDYLYRLTRKTWLFFERFVTAEDHWLPLDNIQEAPVSALAHRTSPTNIGLSLLANLSAYDFSYISPGRLLERSRLTMNTLQKMERFQGHFYNWYDTRNLQPLNPRYVSTVDSGNLSGHLIVLRSGLRELELAPIFRWSSFEALRCTFQILQLHLSDSERIALETIETCLSKACAKTEHDLEQAHSILRELQQICAKIPDLVQPDRTPILRAWSAAFSMQVNDLLSDLDLLCPWLQLECFSMIKYVEECPELFRISNLQDLLNFAHDATDSLVRMRSKLSEKNISPAVFEKLMDSMGPAILAASNAAQARLTLIKELCANIETLSSFDYDFLLDTTTQLLAIGYNVDERRLDASSYDLLASEARLTSFIGIAQNKLPQESWFALGRQLTIANDEPMLLSWSGSMFEYLMPLLVMPNFQHTLLNQTYRSVVQRQIDYGKQRGVPWGVSESGYHAFDTDSNYQYRAFGIPGLGFKRGLGDDLVVAPYATMLALMVSPKLACDNLQKMKEYGFEGDYGFYEAIDYTTSRLSQGQKFVIIKSFMAHHQGMSLLAMAFLLLDRPLQKRFEAEPALHATLSLLYERVPRSSASYSNTSELADIRHNSNEQEFAKRVLHRADHRLPEVQLLSNGRYHLMITSAGGSASRWNDLALTRWREDGTRDHWGSFSFMREVGSNSNKPSPFWSSTLQPTLVEPEKMEVIFSEGRAEFRREDNHFLQHLEVVLSPEDDIELRRTKITNRSRNARNLEITSYSELVLTSAAADASHPAFSNLFMQTEIIHPHQAILCSRRPRSAEEVNPWFFHLAAVHGIEAQQLSYETSSDMNYEVSYETDRSKFIGRTRSLLSPQAMLDAAPLSGSCGSVLDPIASIRINILMQPEQSICLDFVTGIASTREAALALVEKYRDRHLADRVFELAWTHSQVSLRQLNISEVEAQVYARLASSIVFVNPNLRAEPATLLRNRKCQADLWGYAISGDLPIVLLQIKDQENIELVHQLVKAHIYWRSKGLAVDLVIWNEEFNGYRQELQEQIMGMIAALPVLNNSPDSREKQGGIYVRSIDQISVEDRILFLSVARICLSDSQGSLSEQMNRRSAAERLIPPLMKPVLNSSYLGEALSSVVNTVVGTTSLMSGILKADVPFAAPIALPDGSRSGKTSTDLQLSNGIGGFSADGREYVIKTIQAPTVNEMITTPAPWVNVIANAKFGTVISESGQSYTWAENAHEFRLTPWSNDAVSDAGAEVLYLRNEETGKVWSPCSLPNLQAISSSSSAERAGERASKFTCRHGFGYSIFESENEDIRSTMTVFVALDEPVKFTILKLQNLSSKIKNLSVTAYVEWVLAELRKQSQMHVMTELDPDSHAILASNHYHADFHHQQAFFQLLPYVDGAVPNKPSMTGDRREFIGRNRSLQNPVALEKQFLSGRVGAGLDPCAAVQTKLQLLAGEKVELIFMLGAIDTRTRTIKAALQTYGNHLFVHEQLQRVHEYWRKTLDVVQVSTPEPSFDVLQNGWLMYQTLACRMWARSGFYQSGGAFGYRDQLQDSMALVIGKPEVTRAHILLAAAHQFNEGDVQHWWHPPKNRGVRTRCADDYLWLPFVVLHYLKVSGDHSLLAEQVDFLEGRALNKDEESYFELPLSANRPQDVYAHCLLAITHALQFGEHGLSLIGNGDWNDGFDRVGHLGKGESVWLSFFLYQILQEFSQLVEQRGDLTLAAEWRTRAISLKAAINTAGWDGAWFRRAYFDDGMVIGSFASTACQIDSISQSWAVFSGASDSEKTRLAMNAVRQRLVQEDGALIKLLAPPFDHGGENPGYIRGYLPGVRENGGQYTHAAVWTVMAFAQLQQADEAWHLMQMINPVEHGNTSEKMMRYKIEPYVVAADVYAVEPHIGRGGWSWYTGSAGWMLRLMRESLLGLHIEGKRMRIQPCIPRHWPGFHMRYQSELALYDIDVRQDDYGIEASTTSLNGQLLLDQWIPLDAPAGVVQQVVITVRRQAI